MQAKAENVTQILNDSGMSAAQKRYALAKAKKQEAKEKYDQETENIKNYEDALMENYEGTEAEDRELDAVNEKLVDIEAETGLLEAREELRKAEKELVTWAFQKIEKTQFFEDAETDLEDLKENWHKYPNIKEKVIDTAFRLNPES